MSSISDFSQRKQRNHPEEMSPGGDAREKQRIMNLDASDSKLFRKEETSIGKAAAGSNNPAHTNPSHLLFTPAIISVFL